jgi:CBS domain-containing protein
MSITTDRRTENAGPIDSTHTLTVADVMTSPVITVSPDATFGEILDQLYTHGVNAVPVVDEDDTLLGIVTETDLITKEAYTDGRRRHLGVLRDHLAGREPGWVRKSAAQSAIGLMSSPVTCAAPEDDLARAARTMLEGRHKQLPVLKEGRLVGIVARRDLLAPFHRPDGAIAEDVELILADPIRSPEAHEIQATVRNGILTLSGTTRWPADAEAIVAMLARVRGVAGVHNHLTAREPAPQMESQIRLGITGP